MPRWKKLRLAAVRELMLIVVNTTPRGAGMYANRMDEFTDWLEERLHLDEQDIPRSGQWAESGNTLGMLALRLNLLSLEQIDRILDVQEKRGWVDDDFEANRQSGRLFGQIAVELHYLTESQIARLLELQELQRRLQCGAQLVVNGRLDLPDLLEGLAEFTRTEARVAC
ncbi:MAG: hypothetical protein KY476_23035 [Planctomycetes bacterium]|nr:hypothetical protein [Planctomycetota bacterium]